MNIFTGITYPLARSISLLLVALMAGCGAGSNSVTGVGDTTPPSASSTVPANGATGIAINANVTHTFSEAMDPATICGPSGLTTACPVATFTLMQGATAVPGTVTYVGTTAVFNPTANLAPGLPYTATVTTGAKDLAGNALASDNAWTFTTGAAVDATAPTVISTLPADASTDAALGGNVAVTFSEAMDPTTICGSASLTAACPAATFTLQQGVTAVAGAVTYVGSTATFNPTSALAASTVYTATITTGAMDLAGNPLAINKVWSFTTGTVADTTAPTVSSTIPLNAAIGVATNSNINATFNEAMDPATITTVTMTLTQGTTPVPGAVTYLGTTATFNPTSNLAASTVYTANISTGAKDLAGNALAANNTWSFTTAATPAAGPAPVILGTAGNYAILGETLISTTATAGTAITGDVGISPAAATFIQGFSLTLDPSGCFSTPTPSTLVVGKLYAADYNTGGCPTPANLTTAIGDMMIAYADAAGRTTPDFTELGTGLIGGMTLAPGLYKWGTGVTINSDITLNGGPNDVWIFQIAGDLTMASATSMLLAGGALPKNIFWQVGGGTGVAIGTTAHFEGVILATKAITLNTGASGNGRLLAQTAVTLDSNAITQPAP